MAVALGNEGGEGFDYQPATPAIRGTIEGMERGEDALLQRKKTAIRMLRERQLRVVSFRCEGPQSSQLTLKKSVSLWRGDESERVGCSRDAARVVVLDK